ncbi:MAG: glycosyltransferase family 25 protein [Aquabacterium sp.]|nr:glycosyltransferase family 25 protein [Aquabacterium sp.]
MPAPRHRLAVHYINLDSSTERRAGMEAHLAALALPWPVQRFAALRGDGSQARITQSELGCLRSHQAVLQMAATDCHTLVLEDDARLPRQVALHLQALLDQAGDQFDMLFLGGGVEYSYVEDVRALLQLKRAMHTADGTQLRLLPAVRWYRSGTYAYLVHPRAVGRIAAAMHQAQSQGAPEPVDTLYQRLIRRGEVSAAVVFPLLVEQQIDYPSTLSDRNTQPEADRYRAIANLFALEADTNALVRWVLEQAARDGFDADAFVASQLIQQKFMAR